MRIALGIEFDGGPFFGWQSQSHGNTVQDKLECAVAEFLGKSRHERVQVACAGRTDTGVHATGQVVHLDTELERETGAWVRGVNAKLPRSIAVRWAKRVPDSFHARFSATRRSYSYRIYNDPVRSPLWDARAAWCFRPLDDQAMHASAQDLLGEHDFTSFRASECQAKSPVKQVYAVSVRRDGPLIEFTITANAFLHHMVRNLVGSLVYVGLGRQDVRWMKHLIELRDRRLAAPTYCARGLCLVAVEYPPEFNIPSIRQTTAWS
jgi:tRNA pseudouridine38-40 synthase